MSDDTPKLIWDEGAHILTYETLGSLVQRFHDHAMAITFHSVQVIESVQRDQGHTILALGWHSTAQAERIGALQRDNRELRGVVRMRWRELIEFLVVCWVFIKT